MLGPQNNNNFSSNRVGIRTCSDYSPFGVELDGRTVSGGYRYGFQNQEKDDEVKGNGNTVNYKYRMHDPCIGRFFAVDPLAPDYPHNSPYAFSENSLIAFIELEGLEKHFYRLTIEDGKPKLTLTISQYKHEFLGVEYTPPLEYIVYYDGEWYSFTENWNTKDGYTPKEVLIEFSKNPDANKKAIISETVRNEMKEVIETVYLTPKLIRKGAGVSKKNELSKSSQDALKGLKKQRDSHKIKLEEYRKNPDKFDNKGILRGKTPEQRQKIIDGRIKNLEKQINTFEKDIEKIENGTKVPMQKEG